MCEKEVTKMSKEGENSYTENANPSLRSDGHKWVNFKMLLKVQDPQQSGPQIEGEYVGTHKPGLWMLYIKKYHEVLFLLCLVENYEKKEELLLPFIFIYVDTIGTVISSLNLDCHNQIIYYNRVQSLFGLWQDRIYWLHTWRNWNTIEWLRTQVFLPVDPDSIDS